MVLLSGSGFKLMKAEIQSQTAITDLAAFLPGCNFTTISFTSQHESQVINTQCEHYPSIHLFIFVCFPGVGSRGSRLSRVFKVSLSTTTISSFSRGTQEAR